MGGPGSILICPPQLHISLHESVKAGMLPTFTVGEPGVHGAGITGIQGMGVKTPWAADVALDTVGLDNDICHRYFVHNGADRLITSRHLILGRYDESAGRGSESTRELCPGSN